MNSYCYASDTPLLLVDPSGSIALTTIATWASRALLVRLAVVAAGAGAGYAAGSAEDFSEIFGGMGWGQVAGQLVLSEWNSKWNDKDIGEGTPIFPWKSPACRGRLGYEEVIIRYTRGIWGVSEFKLRLEYKTNGCDVTSLKLKKEMVTNSVRIQVLKVIIESVGTGVRDQKQCGCCIPKCVEISVAVQLQQWGFF